MAVNTAFHTNNVAALASEQNLYADLVKEAIQIYGHDVHYVDRTLIALDDVLACTGPTARFDTSDELEVLK